MAFTNSAVLRMTGLLLAFCQNLLFLSFIKISSSIIRHPSVSVYPKPSVMKSTFGSIIGKLTPTRKLNDSDSSDIYALRTMLTMLSLIHANSAVKVPESLDTRSQDLTERESKELKILTTLATVLVMEHKKVAVVANPGNGERVEVFVCTDSITIDESTKSSEANFLGYLRSFVVTTNPRKDIKQETIRPTICNLNDKIHLDSATLDELKADVKRYW